MTLSDAESLMAAYAKLLAKGPPWLAKHLPGTVAKISEAIKLMAALEIANGTLTQNLRDNMAAAIRALHDFVDDETAERDQFIEQVYSKAQSFLPSESQEPTQDQSEAMRECLAQIPAGWEQASRDAMMSRLHMSMEAFSDFLFGFVQTVNSLDRAESLFAQRVYTMIGVEYLPSEKKWFDAALLKAKGRNFEPSPTI